jgi:hypothetical protein
VGQRSSVVLALGHSGSDGVDGAKSSDAVADGRLWRCFA